jgi:hypothetical protein
MKKIIAGIGIAVVAGAGIFYWTQKSSQETMKGDSRNDYKNTSYEIGGEQVLLKNGAAEVASAPGSASKTITQYFGNEVTGDFNNDGREDVAFLLTQSGGGSGTFYYLAVALKTQNGYKGTNAVLLGDHIAPQTTEFRNGEIIVNYAERKPNEPMTTRPSVGVSKYLKVSGDKLSEAPN